MTDVVGEARPATVDVTTFPVVGRYNGSHEPTEAVQALNAALASAQGEFPAIPRGKSVEITTKSGGKFEYEYAPLEMIVEAIRPILAKHDLAIVQLLEQGPSIRTELRHAKGGILSGSFPFKDSDSPQALGSTITYMRRYALTALLGLVTEHDDDGQAAEEMPPDEVSPSVRAAASEGGITPAQHKKIGALLRAVEQASPTHEGQKSYLQEVRDLVGVTSRKDMTREQASQAIEWLTQQLENAKIPL